LIIKRFVLNLLNTSRRNDIFGKYIVYQWTIVISSRENKCNDEHYLYFVGQKKNQFHNLPF
jgi:hypothetical protein